MIFGHSLAECQKMVVSLILFAAAAAGLFIAYDPGFNEALISLTGAGFAVVGVFMAPKFSAEDFSKSIEQLKGAVMSCIGFWVTVPSSTEVKIGTLVASAIAAFLVFYKKNEGGNTPIDA